MNHNSRGDMQRLMQAAYNKGFKSAADLARYIGKTDQAMTNWKNRGIPRKEIFRLAQLLGVSASWLWTGEGSNVPDKFIGISTNKTGEYTEVKRIVFKLSAGISGFEVQQDESPKSPIYFRTEWLMGKGLRAEFLYAFQVSGDSMQPGLYDGDTVVVDTSDIKPVDGDVFALNYEGELVVKRMKRDGGEWWLSSDNPDKTRYSDKRCHDEVFIIGRVVHKQSDHI